MKFISSKTHAILDYAVGLLLIVSPWLFGFYDGGIESWIPIAIGASAILYSLFTNYEYSIKRVILLRTHLVLDVLSGILLAISPWLFKFDEYVYLPHLIIGLGEIGVAIFTKGDAQVDSQA